MASKRATTKYIIVDYTGTEAEIDMAELRRKNRSAGMLDVGVHYVIHRAAEPSAGRHENLCGNHVRGRNADSIFILVAGTFGSLPEDQFNYLDALLDNIRRVHPDATVEHRCRAPSV